MKNGKTLMCLDGKSNTINFKEATPKQVYKWVLNNLYRLNLKEAITCKVELDHYHIKIKGEADERVFIISDLEIIELNAVDLGNRMSHDCGCDKEEKLHCNNIICIDERKN